MVDKKKIPHDDDPGFIYGEKSRSCDGHLILLNAKKSDLGIEAEYNWIILHHPSYEAVTEPTRKKARETLHTFSSIGDPWIDEIQKKMDKVKPKAKKKIPRPKVSKKEPKKQKKKVAKGSLKLESLAQAGVGGGVEKGELSLLPPLDPAGMNQGLVEMLDQECSNQWIVDQILEMSKASRTWVNKKGVEGSSPDWNARSKAVMIALQWKVGTPIQRMEVKQSKEMSMEEMEIFIENSPAFRAALQKILDRFN